MPRYPTHAQDPERAQLVQTYMLLHSQQTSIQRRLSASSIDSQTSSGSSSGASSPDMSPARMAVYHNSPTRQNSRSPHVSPSASPLQYGRRSSSDQRSSAPTVPDILEDPGEEDEGKLYDVNGRIKSTLTDLMNCKTVRSDDRMRSWVQTRLTDAQTALNDSKRRRNTVYHAGDSNAIGSAANIDRIRKLSI